VIPLPLTPDGSRVIVPTRIPDAASRVPDAIQGEGHINMLWTQDNAELCASMGMVPVGTICRDYTWPGKFAPMSHQVQGANAMSCYRRFYNLSEMGTGKTAAAIWAAHYLKSIGKVKRIMVICPLSIMQESWGDTIRNIAIEDQYTVLHNTSRKRRAQLMTLNAPWWIINYHGIETLNKELAADPPDLIIIDEARAYANASTSRWKALAKIVRPTTRIWALTGTPTSHSPMDAYGQVKLLTPRNLPSSMTAFRQMTQRQMGPYNWVNRPDAWETVARVMRPAIKTRKRDVLQDLPPVTVSYRHIPLSTQQQAFYSELKKHTLLTEKSIQVTVAHKAALGIKLLQISSGAVYTDDGTVVNFDISARIAEMVGLIEQSKSATLVFVPFRHTITTLEPVLCPLGFEVMTGDTPIAERTSIVDKLQTGKIAGILAIPSVMSHGITATAASTMIWFAPCDKSETYIQACNRMDRPGQKHPMNVYNLYGSSAERSMYASLAAQGAGQNEMLSWYDSFIKGD